MLIIDINIMDVYRQRTPSEGAQFSKTVGSYASGKNPLVKTFNKLVFPLN
jgi:hypothetical protein